MSSSQERAERKKSKTKRRMTRATIDDPAQRRYREQSSEEKDRIRAKTREENERKNKEIAKQNKKIDEEYRSNSKRVKSLDAERRQRSQQDATRSRPPYSQRTPEQHEQYAEEDRLNQEQKNAQLRVEAESIISRKERERQEARNRKKREAQLRAREKEEQRRTIERHRENQRILEETGVNPVNENLRELSRERASRHGVPRSFAEDAGEVDQKLVDYGERQRINTKTPKTEYDFSVHPPDMKVTLEDAQVARRELRDYIAYRLMRDTDRRGPPTLEQDEKEWTGAGRLKVTDLMMLRDVYQSQVGSTLTKSKAGAITGGLGILGWMGSLQLSQAFFEAFGLPLFYDPVRKVILDTVLEMYVDKLYKKWQAKHNIVTQFIDFSTVRASILMHDNSSLRYTNLFTQAMGFSVNLGFFDISKYMGWVGPPFLTCAIVLSTVLSNHFRRAAKKQIEASFTLKNSQKLDLDMAISYILEQTAYQTNYSQLSWQARACAILRSTAFNMVSVGGMTYLGVLVGFFYNFYQFTQKIETAADYLMELVGSDARDTGEALIQTKFSDESNKNLVRGLHLLRTQVIKIIESFSEMSEETWVKKKVEKNLPVIQFDMLEKSEACVKNQRSQQGSELEKRCFVMKSVQLIQDQRLRWNVQTHNETEWENMPRYRSVMDIAVRTIKTVRDNMTNPTLFDAKKGYFVSEGMFYGFKPTEVLGKLFFDGIVTASVNATSPREQKIAEAIMHHEVRRSDLQKLGATMVGILSDMAFYNLSSVNASIANTFSISNSTVVPPSNVTDSKTMSTPYQQMRANVTAPSSAASSVNRSLEFSPGNATASSPAVAAAAVATSAAAAVATTSSKIIPRLQSAFSPSFRPEKLNVEHPEQLSEFLTEERSKTEGQEKYDMMVIADKRSRQRWWSNFVQNGLLYLTAGINLYDSYRSGKTLTRNVFDRSYLDILRRISFQPSFQSRYLIPLYISMKEWLESKDKDQWQMTHEMTGQKGNMSYDVILLTVHQKIMSLMDEFREADNDVYPFLASVALDHVTPNGHYSIFRQAVIKHSHIPSERSYDRLRAFIENMGGKGNEGARYTPQLIKSDPHKRRLMTSLLTYAGYVETADRAELLVRWLDLGEGLSCGNAWLEKGTVFWNTDVCRQAVFQLAMLLKHRLLFFEQDVEQGGFPNCEELMMSSDTDSTSLRKTRCCVMIRSGPEHLGKFLIEKMHVSSGENPILKTIPSSKFTSSGCFDEGEFFEKFLKMTSDRGWAPMLNVCNKRQTPSHEFPREKERPFPKDWALMNKQAYSCVKSSKREKQRQQFLQQQYYKTDGFIQFLFFRQKGKRTEGSAVPHMVPWTKSTPWGKARVEQLEYLKLAFQAVFAKQTSEVKGQNGNNSGFLTANRNFANEAFKDAILFYSPENAESLLSKYSIVSRKKAGLIIPCDYAFFPVTFFINSKNYLVDLWLVLLNRLTGKITFDSSEISKFKSIDPLLVGLVYYRYWFAAFIKA